MHSRGISWLLLLFLIVVSGASATVITGQTFSNATVNATDSNIFLNFSGVDVYSDRLEVANASISLQNVSYNTTGANVSFVLLNFTTPNTSQFSYQFPNISSSSGNVITILNGLSQNVSNVTITVGTNGIIPSSPLLTFPSLSSQNPSYVYDNATGLVTINISGLPPGVTRIDLSNACGDGYLSGIEQCDAAVANGGCPNVCGAGCFVNVCTTGGGGSGGGGGTSPGVNTGNGYTIDSPSNPVPTNGTSASGNGAVTNSTIGNAYHGVTNYLSSHQEVVLYSLLGVIIITLCIFAALST